MLIAIPGGEVAGALDSVQGIDNKTVIDATNLVGVAPPDGFPSNAEYIKSRTGGPTAKSFNVNLAAIYDQIAEQRTRPGNLWCGEDGARETVERLIRDAGYDPIYAAGLENAAMLESAVRLVFAVNQGGMGPFFYRMAPPGQL